MKSLIEKSLITLMVGRNMNIKCTYGESLGGNDKRVFLGTRGDMILIIKW